MKANRSIPSVTVIPVLIYPDVRAVTWLCAAFGFLERVRIGEDHRSQLKVGDGAVILGDVRNDRIAPRTGEVNHSVLVRVPDVDAHFERARLHGARIVAVPTDFPYGSTPPRIWLAISGHSVRRWRTSHPNRGAVSPSRRSPLRTESDAGRAPNIRWLSPWSVCSRC